jgi:acetyl-CoA carboxylase carboxyl transferase subunit alpha
MMATLRKVLTETLRDLQDHSVDELIERRFQRLMGYGRFKEAGGR